MRRLLPSLFALGSLCGALLGSSDFVLGQEGNRSQQPAKASPSVPASNPDGDSPFRVGKPLDMVPETEFTPKVIGGTLANRTQFPTVCLIRGVAANGETNICSGTLVTSNWVLGAAHCVTNSHDGSFINFRSITVEFSNGERVNATTWVIPATYRGFRNENTVGDVCMYKLARSVNGIRPSLINTSTPRQGDVVTVVGFGFSGSGSTGIQNGTLGAKRYGNQRLDQVTSEQTRWRFDRPEAINTAPGDSGGPQFGRSNAVVSMTSGGTKANASWGDLSYNTRADRYFSFMQKVVSEFRAAGDQPTTPKRLADIALTNTLADLQEAAQRLPYASLLPAQPISRMLGD